MTFSRSCLLLLAALTLSACQRAADPPAAAAPRVAITFLHYFTDSLSGGADDMARVFNSQNTRFELKAVSLDHESFDASMQDTLTTGNPPDIYSYWAGARTAAVVEHLEPLDELWQQAGLDAQFSPALIRAASVYQGKKYFIPLTQHSVGFFYNKQIFQTHGLTPPATWDAFLALCATLKAKGVTPIALGAKDKWPAQFWFDMLLLRTQPLAFREQLMTGQASYADPRVKAAMAHWADLIDQGFFNPNPNNLAWDTGANELVFNGQAAMTLNGTWNIGYFSNAAHQWQAGKDFDFFPFPQITPGLPKVALGPIDGLVLPKKALNKEGAKAALVFLAGVQAQQAFSLGSGALAPNTQVPRSFYGDLQQRVLADIEASPHFAFAYDLSTPPAVAELGLNAFSEFLAFPQAHGKIMDQLARDAQQSFASLAAR